MNACPNRSGVWEIADHRHLGGHADTRAEWGAGADRPCERGDRAGAAGLRRERWGRRRGAGPLQLVISTAMGGTAAILEDVVVDPAALGEGVRSVVLDATIERAASIGCRRITLLTDAENAQAQDFYRRHGFVRSTMVPMRLTLDLRDLLVARGAWPLILAQAPKRTSGRQMTSRDATMPASR